MLSRQADLLGKQAKILKREKKKREKVKDQINAM